MGDEKRQQEHEFLEQERTQAPELFSMGPMVDSLELLKWIGIYGVFKEYPFGHIKYMPQDFIVEEIPLNNQIVTVDVDPVAPAIEGMGTTIYGELVKAGITTFEAKDTLARILDIDVANIGSSGLKDEIAITAQRLSIRNVQSPEKLLNLQEESFFIKNVRRGKGVLRRGELLGNRFIITVRTTQTLTDVDKKRIQDTVSDISENGFWNFFSFQRFAAPRLNGHLIGKQLLQGKYEEAVKTLLSFKGLREEPYFHSIREYAQEHWGDWKSIQERMSPLPTHFSVELPVLQYLVAHSQDYRGALAQVPEQVRLWVYAYSSFLFNKKLSLSIVQEEVDVGLPFITSRNPQDQELYADFLKEDGVQLNGQIYRDFPFMRFSSNAAPSYVPTLQKVEISQVHFEDKMVVLAFALPKGAYATTFLAHFFQLSSESPVPKNIDTHFIDAKELLGLGSLASVLERFKKPLGRIQKERSWQE
jgi:TruD family tRNA pseudouridine synthase